MCSDIVLAPPRSLARRAVPSRERTLTFALPALTAAVALAAWQFVAMHWAISPVILPAPSDVGAALAHSWRELLQQSVYTGGEALVACVLSAGLGALVAAVLAGSAMLREMMYPNLVLFQLIPKIALAPLFVVWLGIDSPSRLVFSIFISFFPVALGSLTGLLSTPTTAVRLCLSLTASRWQTFFHVQVPYALPFFFSGLKVARGATLGPVLGDGGHLLEYVFERFPVAGARRAAARAVRRGPVKREGGEPLSDGGKRPPGATEVGPPPGLAVSGGAPGDARRTALGREGPVRHRRHRS